MPDAFAEVIEELCQQRRLAGAEREPRAIWRQHHGLRRAGALEAQQAAMRGIEVEEQAVGDFDRCRRARAAVGVETHDLVGAVAVFVHQMHGRRQLAVATIGAHREPCQRVGGDVGVPGAQLAPGDFAVAVAVQADRKFEIAQRDVPLAAYRRAFHAERKVAVAGFVCERGGAEKRRSQDQEPHGFITFSFAATLRRRVSS